MKPVFWSFARFYKLSQFSPTPTSPEYDILTGEIEYSGVFKINDPKPFTSYILFDLLEQIHVAPLKGDISILIIQIDIRSLIWWDILS